MPKLTSHDGVQLYICQKIFSDGMRRFIANESPNFIQFYFEEAHNLFPKKEDKDLTQIYNRLAKEGAKLRLGLVYATQEVSSISSNVLKNTQNWFVSHLNNTDELREIDKYYDYEDFVESLRRTSDRGFIRMKTSLIGPPGQIGHSAGRARPPNTPPRDGLAIDKQRERVADPRIVEQ